MVPVGTKACRRGIRVPHHWASALPQAPDHSSPWADQFASAFQVSMFVSMSGMGLPGGDRVNRRAEKRREAGLCAFVDRTDPEVRRTRCEVVEEAAAVRLGIHLGETALA